MKRDTAWGRYESSVTLVLTFAFGAIIGSTLTYAFLDASPGAGAPPAADAAAPAADAAPAPPPPVNAKGMPLPSAADLEGLWPARHLALQLLGVALTDDERAVLAEFKPAGVVLRPHNVRDPQQAQALVRAVRAAAGMGAEPGKAPFILYDDGAGPVRPFGLDHAPAPEEIGTADDPLAAKQLGRAWAAAARAHGIDALVGPRLDVFTPEITKPELRPAYFGDAPDAVARIGLAVADGLAAGGLLPVVAHYPGAGPAMKDADGGEVILETDLAAIARGMSPFQLAATQTIPGIFVAHVAVPAIHTEAPDRPASTSAKLVAKTLREQFGYKGVVVAEDLAALRGERRRRIDRAFVEALLAGCDVAIAGEADRDRVQTLCREVLRAEQAGQLPKALLDESKARIQTWFDAIAAAPPIEDVPPPDLTPPAPEAPPQPAPAEDAAPKEEAAKEEAPKEETPKEETPKEEAAAAPPGEAALPPADAPPVEKAPQPDNTDRVEHRVKRGETLTDIAMKHGVGVSDLKAWNALPEGKVKSGQKLLVYVPKPEPEPAPAPEPPAPETPPAAEAAPADAPAPDAPNADAAPPETAPPADAPPAAPAGDAPTDTPPADAPPPAAADAAAAPPQATTGHTIVRGDTLYKIAQRYGTTPEALVQLNGLRDPNDIQLGRTIQVPAAP